MLQSLHVKNLALIDEVEVDFYDGLNILTGETGAGKSIILGSVNLALGGKFHKDLIRKGAEYGFVELSFFVDQPEVIKKLEEKEIYLEEGVIVLSRRFTEGRSVCRINGETVTMSVLKEVANLLIDIHGQHEHQSLLYKKNHLQIVDDFADQYICDTKEKVEETYRRYQTIERELKMAQKDESEREKELAFLRFERDAIQNAMLRIGEDEELEQQYQKMLYGKRIVESISEALCFTGENHENASDSLSRAIRALSDVSDVDNRMKELFSQLVDVDNLLSDLNRELSDYKEECEFSEEEFFEIETRLNQINHMKMRYGQSIEEILQYAKEKEAEIEKLTDYDQYVEGLRKSLETARKELSKYSKELSKLRKEQAKILEQAIEEGLYDLNFVDIKFEIAFEELPSFTANGIDDIEFMISLNPGQPVRSLIHVASGGELSRIMLAIKTVMAKRDHIMTLIFDEIDVGISGRTAQKVSEKMAFIGKNHQVICITHLAQIAAMADHNYLIEKKVDDLETTTSIRRITKKEREDEIARILGGVKITDAVHKNAVEMIALADQIKKAL